MRDRGGGGGGGGVGGGFKSTSRRTVLHELELLPLVKGSCNLR